MHNEPNYVRRWTSKECKLSIGSDTGSMIKGIKRIEKLGRTIQSKWASFGDIQDAYNNRI